MSIKGFKINGNVEKYDYESLDNIPDLPSGGGLSTTAANLLIEVLQSAVYSDNVADKIASLKEALASGGGDEPVNPDEPDTPDEPDEPVTPEVTLSSISATYSGGDVVVGTEVTDLTGIVVTATYSDGSTATVTGYTLSGEIAEGSNTITVNYGGKTTTFTVVGVAESGGDIPADATRLAGITSSGTQYIDTGIVITPHMSLSSVWDIPANPGSDTVLFGGSVTGKNRTYFNLYSGEIAYVGFCSTAGSNRPLSPSVYGQNDVKIYTNTLRDQTAVNGTWTKRYTVEYGGVSNYCSAIVEMPPSAEPVSLYLFAQHNGDAINAHISATLKEFIICSDDELTNEVMHLVPVRDGNGVVCMYDTVGKQYLHNAGSGDFNAVEVV